MRASSSVPQSVAEGVGVKLWQARPLAEPLDDLPHPVAVHPDPALGPPAVAEADDEHRGARRGAGPLGR